MPLKFQAGCKTTAMGIMPHTDVEAAVGLALSLDIPFWPQLPNLSFYEDMYVQTSQSLPGIIIDLDSEKISFDSGLFEQGLDDYSRRMADPETFALSDSYSAVYRRFLAEDLQGYTAIRGQVTGPVSFGFRVADENAKPIIYNEGVRALLYDFIQRKVNIQYQQLRKENNQAFVWLDEPGLGWVFSGLSGYNDVQAREDYKYFLAGLDGIKALHLCANVNLPYLLGLGVELLSFDAYQMEVMPKGYAEGIADFLKSGGVISWGLVPTDLDSLMKETPETLAALLRGYWEVIALNTDVTVERIAEQSLVAPARCCLKNAGCVGAGDDLATGNSKSGANLTVEERLVGKAFSYLASVSEIIRGRFHL